MHCFTDEGTLANAANQPCHLHVWLHVWQEEKHDGEGLDCPMHDSISLIPQRRITVLRFIRVIMINL